ncbi:GntR family transcriptional regulator [Shewanella sp. Choline-02u-19]|uniref:aminotransferase-like domain-containing protein n=1 Tax=unclassified Shewanella TaxID=196818 RepID=UPI000C32042B|nr:MULTISPECIES: PLP-dependent aminotransferase family protein [unclassified Shewanella]PKH57743.1 GntR family transcriptional regulator [Shewanella sp. Bg11-22]PKI29838.1 GntR family transcriptional regulator [Shewanella sp. Choline-02u-19]
MAKYENLVEQIRRQIQNGIWKVGDKLPSLRKQTEISGVSLMTVLHAYQVLESQGWIVSHARSGYFVAPQVQYLSPKKSEVTIHTTENIDINDFIFDVLQANRTPHLVDFCSVYPDPKLYPRHQVNKSLMTAARNMPTSSALDNLPPGNEDLRQLIAKRYAAQGMNVHPDEIVITAGALEALNLSLQAVTQAGDWVVVESPTFYGALQSLQKLNLRALSVRTHPQDGIDLEALEKALQSHSVKACWLMTNHQNPLGCSLSDEKKQALIQLLADYNVYLIEDDVYSELYFGGKKPLPAKAFDQQGMTMHCSSFSKCLVAGFRIGWVAAGRMALPIQKLQLMSTLSASTPIQLALAKYLSSCNYEKHLRQLRRKLEQRKFANWQVLRTYFPANVSIHYSEGGYFLWIELPEHLNATTLYQRALKERISIAPGKMFSASKQFNHCFRLNSSFECSDREVGAIKRLAELIQNMLDE